MSKAMLIDTTRCIGCRACQIACKSWNNLPAAPTTFSETGSNPRFLSSKDFNRIIFREVVSPQGEVSWHFISRRCMHCLDPACVSACPVGALQKLASGPVVYDDGRCIGCRYCMMACPFQIPKFEWEAAVPYIRKCTFLRRSPSRRPGTILFRHLSHRRAPLWRPGCPYRRRLESYSNQSRSL